MILLTRDLGGAQIIQVQANAHSLSMVSDRLPPAVERTSDPSILCRSTLRELLRSATSEIHERLHAHRGFAAIQAGTIDHSAYTALLIRLYGFHRPFESAMRIPVERSTWLEYDLENLGVAARQRSTLPTCVYFPKSASPEYVLGAQYVVEGSAIGGRGLARQLDVLLGSGSIEGRRFFNGHGVETGTVWQNYLATLSAAPKTKATQTAIIAGATATFSIFEQWLEGWNDQYG